MRSYIQVLDDDVLLNIFYVYRLDMRDEDDSENMRFSWDHQRWWYKLAQVSRKWRYLILASPIRLDIHLLCTYGVSIADMLAHSPPLPLAVWYTNGNRKMTAEDEEGVLLALSHRDRVHRIALWMPAPNFGKFIAAMDAEFPILERICIGSPPKDSAGLVFPGTFQAPNLRHVWTTWRPIGSPLVTTTVGLVNLELMDIPPSPWFPPSYILARLLLMPQLATLRIHFHSPHPNRDVETPSATHVTLPNLQVFSYRGVSAYLESLAQIRAPTLSILDVQFFNQLSFTVPRLLQIIRTSESRSFSFSAVQITFDGDFVDLMAGPDRWRQRSLHLQIMCKQLDWQVASAVQILETLSPVLSGVEELILSHVAHSRSSESESHNEVDRTEWRKLFRPFSNVKVLCVPNSLPGGLSHSLRSEFGEMPLELLPNLMVLQHDGSSFDDTFTSFINERQAAGHPVRLGASFPALPEDKFEIFFTKFACSDSAGTRTTERDFTIEGRPINPWLLHRAVFLHGGFGSVSTNDEWPIIGAVVGFPAIGPGDASQPPRCAPLIAQRLQQLYRNSLRLFDQTYMRVLARLRKSQLSSVPSQPPQAQAHPRQPTEADYQTLLTITSESSLITSHAMSILPRFAHTSSADLEAHRIPQHIVAFVEQNRDQLQRTAQDWNGFRAALTSTNDLQLDNRAQFNQGFALQAMRRPPQLTMTSQLQQLQRQGLTPPRKPNALDTVQLFNNGVGRPPTGQSMNASGIPFVGTQIAAAAQIAGPIQIRRPTREDMVLAQRWVEEQKTTVFGQFVGARLVGFSVPEFDVTPYGRNIDRLDKVLDIIEQYMSDVPEYCRDLNRLDNVLASIEQYIHLAYVSMKKDDVIRRIYHMVASTTYQLEEINKFDPRFILELHTIRGMIQEADNMDKGLRTVLGIGMRQFGGGTQQQRTPTAAVATAT